MAASFAKIAITTVINDDGDDEEPAITIAAFRCARYWWTDPMRYGETSYQRSYGTELENMQQCIGNEH